jgi:ssDNA-binding Zn-finger/Zn-ribbon topoisomerase 1
MSACPFCGGPVVLHQGEQTLMTFVLCGARDDGRDGCGAVVSFRPNLTGKAVVDAWNRRAEPRP